MIILTGPARTGNSTLQNEIKEYLGNELCENWPVTSPESALYYEHIKLLGLFSGIDAIYRSKKTNKQLLVLFI